MKVYTAHISHAVEVHQSNWTQGLVQKRLNDVYFPDKQVMYYGLAKRTGLISFREKTCNPFRNIG